MGQLGACGEARPLHDVEHPKNLHPAPATLDQRVLGERLRRGERRGLPAPLERVLALLGGLVLDLLLRLGRQTSLFGLVPFVGVGNGGPVLRSADPRVHPLAADGAGVMGQLGACGEARPLHDVEHPKNLHPAPATLDQRGLAERLRRGEPRGLPAPLERVLALLGGLVLDLLLRPMLVATAHHLLPGLLAHLSTLALLSLEVPDLPGLPGGGGRLGRVVRLVASRAITYKTPNARLVRDLTQMGRDVGPRLCRRERWRKVGGPERPGALEEQRRLQALVVQGDGRHKDAGQIDLVAQMARIICMAPTIPIALDVRDA